jgi:hypothetical protein
VAAGTRDMYANGSNIYFTLTTPTRSTSATFNGDGSITFNSLGLTLAKGEEAKIKIEAAPALSTTGNIKFDIEANGSDAQGNPVKTIPSFANQIVVVSQGESSVTTSTAIKNSVIAEKSAATIAQWTVTVKNQTLTLKNVTLTGTFDTSSITNWTLSYTKAGVNGTVNATSISSTALTANDMNERLAPGTYTFTAKINAGTKGSSSDGKVNISGATVTFDETSTSALQLSYNHVIVKNYPVITISRPSNPSLTDVFTIKVTAGSGTDPVVINGFDLSVKSGGTAQMVMIKDVNGNLLGSDTVSDQMITLNSPVTIDQGTTHEFIVTSPDTVNPGSYIATLKDVNYSVDGTPYANGNNTYYNIANWANLNVSWRVSN